MLRKFSAKFIPNLQYLNFWRRVVYFKLQAPEDGIHREPNPINLLISCRGFDQSVFFSKAALNFSITAAGSLAPKTAEPATITLAPASAA